MLFRSRHRGAAAVAATGGIILDDNFSSLVAGIEAGRTVFANLRNGIRHR